MTADYQAPPGHRVVISRLGETPLEAFETHSSIEPQEPPDPASLGGSDVVIAVRSAQVGWVDLLMSSGLYQHRPEPPYCPGLEYSGVVAWTGADVAPDEVAVGDRVMIDGFRVGPRSSGAYQRYGGFASYAVAPKHAVLPIPEPLSFDQAAAFLGSYETAYHCLIARGRLQAGETVLIHGASGATGLAAVHIAKLVGATVIATGRSDAKLAVVRDQGADHVVNSKGDDGVRRFRDDVKQLTGGRGADVVYDGVGGAISLESLRCVRFGARYLIVGWAATPFVARGKGGAPNANVLPTNLIMMKGLDVLGCPTVIGTQNDPSLRPPRLQALLEWVRAGRLAPHVSHVYPLREYQTALRAKWEGNVIGGCVLRPGETSGD